MPDQQPTTPEEILWSVRDRIKDRLSNSNESNVKVVSDLDDVNRAIQNVDGIIYLIEGGDVMPDPDEGWFGGGICNLTSVFRFTVDVWRVSLVDMPTTADEHLIELQNNLYVQAAAVIHAVSSELLETREETPQPIGSSEAVPIVAQYRRDSNSKAVIRIPFDQKFDWNIERHNPAP